MKIMRSSHEYIARKSLREWEGTTQIVSRHGASYVASVSRLAGKNDAMRGSGSIDTHACAKVIGQARH
jgi:hypothetical protein